MIIDLKKLRLVADITSNDGQESVEKASEHLDEIIKLLASKDEWNAIAIYYYGNELNLE